MTSRANSLRVYGERLQELGDIDFSEIGDDLIEFAEQWEAELATPNQEAIAYLNVRISHIEKFIAEGGIGYQPQLDEYIKLRNWFGKPTELDAAGILIRPQIKLE